MDNSIGQCGNRRGRDGVHRRDRICRPDRSAHLKDAARGRQPVSNYRKCAYKRHVVKPRGPGSSIITSARGTSDRHRYIGRRSARVPLPAAASPIRFLISMLQASDITFQVGDRKLISDVSVSFAAGEFHLVIGPNGAGKSTLIKVLARLLRPQNGQVEYQGEDIRHTSEADLAKRRAVLSQ